MKVINTNNLYSVICVNPSLQCILNGESTRQIIFIDGTGCGVGDSTESSSDDSLEFMGVKFFNGGVEIAGSFGGGIHLEGEGEIFTWGFSVAERHSC